VDFLKTPFVGRRDKARSPDLPCSGRNGNNDSIRPDSVEQVRLPGMTAEEIRGSAVQKAANLNQCGIFSRIGQAYKEKKKNMYICSYQVL
jgi:hypothetical protein